MNKQSGKLNGLCLSGFLLSILAPLVCFASSVFTYNPLWYRLGILISSKTLLIMFFCMLALAMAMAVLGFVLSIKGIASCRKSGEKGSGLGAAGIVFAGMFLTVFSMIMLYANVFRESPPTSTTPAVKELVRNAELDN